jgi:hypothetical protein
MRGGQDVELELQRLKGEIAGPAAKEIEATPGGGNGAQASPADQPQAGETA